MNKLIFPFVLATTALPACAIDSAPAQQESDAQAKTQGIVLKGTAANKGLQIAARLELDDDDGVWSSYLKRVQISRKGKSFSCYCGLGGNVSVEQTRSVMSCTKYGKDVSYDQMLELSIEQRNDSFVLTDVTLTGTELKSQLATLSGGKQGKLDLPLIVKKSASDPRLNPFAAMDFAESAIAPLLGELAYSEPSQQMRSIGDMEYALNEHFAVWVTAAVGADETASFDVVLAKEKYEPAKGLVTLEQARKRAKDALPKPPVCQEEGPAGSVADPVPSIVNAISPLGGPTFGLSHEVALSEVPAAVRAELEKGAQEIEDRGFDGTDYSASVFGFYAVHRACGDAAIVAYVVWGGGSGEPDYHDGVVIGVNLQGQRVHEDEMDG